MAKKLTIVLSQHQGKHPIKRQLEEEIAARLMIERDVELALLPHLYDLTADHTGMLFLRGVNGPLVVFSWLFHRASRWVLDRQGIRGREGLSLLNTREESDEELDEAKQLEEREEREAKRNANGAAKIERPNRPIYCIDLKDHSKVEPYLTEIRRLVAEHSVSTVPLMSWISGSPQPAQLERFLNAPDIVALSLPVSLVNGHGHLKGESHTNGATTPVLQIEEAPDRRWYPVIDYDRCTNCMECIDFCLFGVYGVDKLDQILVEAQDNCKKGCPACSRVCPENAILFPQHKSPGIAGAEGEVAGLKIDLSQLFGAVDPLKAAVAERDAELVKDGRGAVGMSIGIPKRQTGVATGPRDDLDDLMDGLNSLDL